MYSGINDIKFQRETIIIVTLAPMSSIKIPKNCKYVNF